MSEKKFNFDENGIMSFSYWEWDDPEYETTFGDPDIEFYVDDDYSPHYAYINEEKARNLIAYLRERFPNI